MEWIAAQLKFNCLLGQSKIWCTNEFSFCYTFPICHKWIFMSFHIGWSESGGQRRKFTFRRLAKTIFPDQSLLRRRLSMADYERREASTSSVAPTPCPSPPACLRDIRTHSLFIFGSSFFSWCCFFSSRSDFFIFLSSFPTTLLESEKGRVTSGIPKETRISFRRPFLHKWNKKTVTAVSVRSWNIKQLNNFIQWFVTIMQTGSKNRL